MYEWTTYFKLINLAPGKVIVQQFGLLDFSQDVPVEICQKLYENDWPNLKITPEGERKLYGLPKKRKYKKRSQNSKADNLPNDDLDVFS